MEIAVCYCANSTRLGYADCCLENGLGKCVLTMGGEIGTGQFNGDLRSIGNVIERNPGDMMFNRIRVRNLLAYGNLDFDRFTDFEVVKERYDRHVLFSFPVGGFDEGSYHIFSRVERVEHVELLSRGDYSSTFELVRAKIDKKTERFLDNFQIIHNLSQVFGCEGVHCLKLNY